MDDDTKNMCETCKHFHCAKSGTFISHQCMAVHTELASGVVVTHCGRFEDKDARSAEDELRLAQAELARAQAHAIRQGLREDNN